MTRERTMAQWYMPEPARKGWTDVKPALSGLGGSSPAPHYSFRRFPARSSFQRLLVAVHHGLHNRVDDGRH